MELKDRIKLMFQAATRDYDSDPKFEQFDDNLSPNMRALRLTLTITDSLAAMGVSVADVVSMGLDITDRYCKRKVQFDINSSLIIASQYRGDDMEPLTLTRQIAPRSTNNMLIQSLQQLVRDISRDATITLEDAEYRLDEILKSPRTYPYWLTTIGSAAISAGVGVLFGAKPFVIAIMFFAGAMIAYMVRTLSHKRVPLFFVQIFSSLFITLVAAGTTMLSKHIDAAWINDLRPNLIVVGGIIMLVAGLAVVGAVQDAIDEFYITANARLLKVVMLTIGIVTGVLFGLYFAREIGIYIDVDSTQKFAQDTWLQVLGAAIIAAGYALSTQTGKVGIVLSGGLGAIAWASYQAISGITPLSIIVASGVAAVIIGVIGTLISRASRVPSIALMTAGIVPLVPGLTLYNGLFALVGNTDSTYSFNEATLTLFTAALIALSIASGVSLGHLVARPVRRTLVRARNSMPKRKTRSLHRHFDDTNETLEKS